MRNDVTLNTHRMVIKRFVENYFDDNGIVPCQDIVACETGIKYDYVVEDMEFFGFYPDDIQPLDYFFH